ncbi:MAG: HEAT repeat domain-containing protein [Elusimicrobiota bacterium]
MNFFLLLAASAAAAAVGPEQLGRDLATAAARAGISRVTVQAFAPAGSASAEIGRDAADGVLRGILDSGRVRALERERLSPVLAERRLSAAAGGGAEFPRLAQGEGMVLGRVRRTAAGWTASVRLVSSATGEIVAGGEAAVAVEVPPPAEDAYPPVAALIDAAHALAETRDARWLKSLADSSEAPGPNRAAAVLALSQLDGDDLALGDAVRDREPVVRFAGALALGRSAASWGEGPLRQMLKNDPSWPARFAAAQGLGRYASAASAAALTAAWKTDASWRVRRMASVALAERGEAVP